MSEYIKSYAPNPKTIRIGEYDVPLPVQPPLEEMINFGVRRRQQVFERTKVPKGLKRQDERDQRKFIQGEWHKRRNGVWYLINGKPVYLTGPAYVFFNYWVVEAGGFPDFRMEAVEFFLLWEMVERDKNCFGLLDIKARRLGDTEKALFLLWEYTSRVRRAWAGMQNIIESDAKDNFKRIVEANKSMIYFFKPVSRGSTDPEKVLEFKYPEARVTNKSISIEEVVVEEENKLRKPLKSRIDYETSKLKRYDGKRLSRYHMDEPGKTTEFNPVKQWGIVKHGMSLQGGQLVVGKAIFTTTVEELETGKTLKNARKMWDQADPNSKDANGRTANGLMRVFRNGELAAPVDKFGFHKKKEMREYILAERKALLDKGWLEDYTDLCRRLPLDLDDVFTLPAQECRLLPALLDNRLKQIREGFNPDGTEYKPLARRYTLVWKSGIPGGEVEAVYDPQGRWEISQHPVRPNYFEFLDGHILPGNRRIYKSGLDPVDHTTEDGGGSKVGMSVYRHYDDSVDGHLQKDEHGEIIPQEVFKMQTDQFVCAYSHRPDDPYEAYEDCLKTMIYFGTTTLSENQKPGFLNWISSFIEGRYALWASRRPSQTVTTTNKGRTATGAPATPSTVNLYVDALLYYVKRRLDCTHLPLLIGDWRQFKVTNRKDRDLTVASGFNLLDAYDNVQKLREERKESWTDANKIWKKYKRAA